jgi:hypothetical protein
MLKKLILIFGIFLFSIFVCLVYLYLQPAPEINEELLVSEISIEYPSEYNYRQSLNDCGPFSVAAVVRALNHIPVSSKTFAKSMEWRLRNKYTLPMGLEKQLKKNGIKIETPNLRNLNNEDKIKYLKTQLSLYKPIILLGDQDGYQHYITLLGFDVNNFYVYNSLMDKGEGDLTIDNNGEFPGNTNMNKNDLLDFWSNGGMYGMYNWYAIINSV